MRILQPIRSKEMKPQKSGLIIDVRVVSSDPDLASKIDWVAILEENTDARASIFHSKLEYFYSRLGGATILTGSTYVERLDLSKRLTFCIQLKPPARSLTIRSAALTARHPCQQSKEIQSTRHAKTVQNQKSARKQVAVIAWDMGHNPVGRAFLLADALSSDCDVLLIGPIFKRYGSDLWKPLKDSKLNIQFFEAESMSEFIEFALEFVRLLNPDIVYVCKPRLPSILLGLLIKHRAGCPVVIDVDDHELSFFKDESVLTSSELLNDIALFDDLDIPYGETWTRLCESLVGSFDAVTVSNSALQQRFGGTIIGHARDEHVFAEDRHLRDIGRNELGFSQNDRVVLFLGTPRAHKGIFRLAAAINRVDDPRLALCVIGSSKEIEAQLKRYPRARIYCYPDQPWEKLPQLLNVADGVCLLQDVSSPVSQYQMPAKLTDALALGIPIAVTNVAPFQDLPAPAIIQRIETEADLDDFLRGVANGTFGGDEYKARARSYFLRNYSYTAIRKRLFSIFAQIEGNKTCWSDDFSGLLKILERRFGVALPIDWPEWGKTEMIKSPSLGRKFPASFDLAFFWKQNDTGIYGRRHDMLIKYLSRHPRVRRIVQFDAPIAISALSPLTRNKAVDQANVITSRSIERFLRAADTDNVFRRTFIFRQQGDPLRFLGAELPDKNGYVEWVGRMLREISHDQSFVSWVAPVVFDYPEVHDAIGFRASITDIIDDQRTMTSNEELSNSLNQAYTETLKRADMVFANCQAAANTFLDVRQDIHVVPNAAERLELQQQPPVKPYELRQLTGPIIGYVGNLRDRIDIELISRMSRERPNWQIVLIGSAHGKPNILRLRGRPNLHFLGVKPYETAINYIRHFDVAIMPHLHNEISAAMNPLKLYVYASAGVPIVTTAVSNIEEMTKYAQVASNHDQFIAEIDSIISEPCKTAAESARRDIPYESTWASRVESIFQHIDKHL